MLQGEDRPWGRFFVLYQDDQQWLKRLIIYPGQSLSLQYHAGREEYWLTQDVGVRHWYGQQSGAWIMLPPGVVRKISKGEIHRLENPTDRDVIVHEWAVGKVAEDDITRVSDMYGRVHN